MSYGLRTPDGLHGLGLLDGRLFGGSRGLGVFNPPPQPAYENCLPRDVPCTQRNQVLADAYVQAMFKAQADSNRDDCLANLALNPGTPDQNAAGLARCNAAYAAAFTNQAAVNTAEGLSPAMWAGDMVTMPSSVGTFPIAAPLAAAPVVLQNSDPVYVAPSTVASSAAGSSTFVLPTIGGFDLSTIPWWGWAGAAGVALVMMKGGR
jgi:hypothetical protein